MEDLLQLVLEADDDAGLSEAMEQFYALGPGLKKEFCVILKAFKVDGLGRLPRPRPADGAVMSLL